MGLTAAQQSRNKTGKKKDCRRKRKSSEAMTVLIDVTSKQSGEANENQDHVEGSNK